MLACASRVSVDSYASGEGRLSPAPQSPKRCTRLVLPENSSSLATVLRSSDYDTSNVWTAPPLAVTICESGSSSNNQAHAASVILGSDEQPSRIVIGHSEFTEGLVTLVQRMR